MAWPSSELTNTKLMRMGHVDLTARNGPRFASTGRSLAFLGRRIACPTHLGRATAGTKSDLHVRILSKFNFLPAGDEGGVDRASQPVVAESHPDRSRTASHDGP